MIFTAWNAYKENQRAAEFERELRRQRNDIMTNFKNYAEDIGREISKNARAYMTQNVDPIVAAFDEKIKAIEAMTANEKIKSEKLSELLKQTENLIADIQACK